MSLVTIPYRFTCRGGTASALATANETPLARELYVETDTGLMKLGDGTTAYNSLAYINPAAAATPCLIYTTDTGSTADSDPGAGLMKWNNATQASATKLFFDDADADTGTDLSAYFTELAASSTTGILQIVNEAGDFQIYKWTGIADGTGYFKFTVTSLAASASFADNKTVRVAFYPMPASSGGSGSTAWTLVNSWDFSVSGASAPIEADLTGYSEVLVVVSDVTLVASGYRGVQFSGNGGSTWATSYDYINSTGTRATTSNSFIALHTTATSSAARSANGEGALLANCEAPFDTMQNFAGTPIQFRIPNFGSGTKPNRIKVGGFTGSGTTTTNMNGGKVNIFAR